VIFDNAVVWLHLPKKSQECRFSLSIKDSQMLRPGQGILKYLKKQGRGADLPLDVLRKFQEFEKVLAAGLGSYEGKDPIVTYAMQSFTKAELFTQALALSDEDEFPAVRRCYEDLMEIFKNDKAFNDGITLMTWIMFNFPATVGNAPISLEILKRSPELADELSPFITEMTRSRFGLYEVLADKDDQSSLKELFTGNLITLNQTLGGMGCGSIALCRVMDLCGKKVIFGDASEFPKARRKIIESMVSSKMSIYFPSASDVSSYEQMMRLAGPYWFSIIAQDYRDEILNPDHYLCYY
jgi:hypothetical protein